jgi:hypothetical protein
VLNKGSTISVSINFILFYQYYFDIGNGKYS